MRKTVIYIAILAILSGGIYYFLFRTPDSPYSKAEAGFNIRDTGAVGKLFIASSDGDAITAVRTDSGWIVNNRYRALPSTLNQVLMTLAQQVPLYPVTQAAVDNVVKALATDGVKVEVYGKDGKKLSVFYVGGMAVNNTGTNMMMEGAQTPYVVHVPGFNGYLTSRYTPMIRDWRDRTIFNVPAAEIKSVSIQYADKPINSFEIDRENDTVLVKADAQITGLGKPNARRARVFLKYFENVNCEGYLNGLPDMDTTLRTAPKHATIDVTDIHGKRWHMESFWMALNKRSKNQSESSPDVPDDFDADRLYAVINGGRDTVMIQRFAFRNIFHKAFEFYQPDGSGAHTEDNDVPKNVMMHKNQ